MPIDISIGDPGQGPVRITADPTGLLNLPSIRLTPLMRHQPAPLVVAVFADVIGPEEGVVLLGPAYLSGEALKRFDDPLPLIDEIACLPRAVRLARQRFPAGRYWLKVKVVYRSPPAFPGARPGADASLPAERELEVPADLSPPVDLSATWRHQELTAGQTAAELHIVAEHLPRGVVPVVSLFDPNKVVHPALADALGHQLTLSPAKLVGEHDPKGISVFEQRIECNLDGGKHADLVRAAPLRVELRITAGQTKPAPEIMLRGAEALRIDFPENQFPGYPVLDLGTSSTFALLYCSQLPFGEIPAEQEQTFRGHLTGWLSRKDGLFGSREWDALLADVAKRLRLTEPGLPADMLRKHLIQNPPSGKAADHAVHALLRALESSPALSGFPPPQRLQLRRELSAMYARGFRRFPLEKQGLIDVHLDPSRPRDDSPDRAGAIADPIPSTTAVLSCNPLGVEVGSEAEQSRLQIGTTNPAALLTQFHSSPKIYYALLGQSGTSVPVSVGAVSAHVKPRDFIVAALKRLRERIEGFCEQSGRVPRRRFGRLVMPFPTSAPLSVRQELLEAAREAGFDRPSADLDEALSAVVFYLVSPFGVDLEMGLEAFRTRCRPVFEGEGAQPREWLQNILLIDIGGGTTDIALIEVRLRDMQAKGAGDGSCGRYYKLTPKLLGATGRGQLAGNLLSLGVYHSLKKRFVDAVLSAVDPAAARADAVPEDAERVGRLLEVARAVHPKLRDASGARYRPGAILDHYSEGQLWAGRDALAGAAFDLVNDVLPTTWHGLTGDPASSAARRFHDLWGLAEQIKVKVFGKPAEAQPEGVAVSRQQVAGLLGISEAACEALGIGGVTFGGGDFRAAIDPPLREIARLGLDLVKTRLVADADGKRRTLDRIVLTGQTCRLPRVRQVVTETFQAECERATSDLRWDPAALTFEGDYAKQAAALGAAYAQLLREHRVPPDVQDRLHGNVLDIDIQNLFFFLQSGFRWRTPITTDSPTLLAPGRAFTEFDREGVGRLRSEWSIKPSETTLIDRFDFEGDNPIPWGEFDCWRLAEQIGMSFASFQKEVSMAIETDHRLVVSLLFCRGPERHSALPPARATIDLKKALRALGLLARTSEDWLAAVSGWTLAVNVKGGFGRELFGLNAAHFTTTFRDGPEGAVCKGAVSDDLPACPDNRRDKFYVRPSDGSRGWAEVGELERPEGKARRRVSVRAILDESGQLRVHLGEIPFWEAATDEKLLDAGTVLRKPLLSPTLQPDPVRNPFCGRH